MAGSDDESQIRHDLVAVFRAVALHGWSDLVYTHASARLPGTNRYLLNPFGELPNQLRASDLIEVAIDEPVESAGGAQLRNPAGVVTHTAVYAARPDVGCVIHLHTLDGTAVAAQQDGLLPITQKAMMLQREIAYHDYEGITLDPGERERLVRDLGTKSILILRNHGTLVVGRDCGDAFVRAYNLERACSMQVRALAGGRPLVIPSATVQERVAVQASDPALAAGDRRAWNSVRALLDRLHPSAAEAHEEMGDG